MYGSFRHSAAGLAATVLLGLLPAGAENRAWSLEDILDRTRAQHPLFRAEAAAELQRGAQVEELRGAWDWTFRSDPYALYSEPVDASVFAPDDRTQVLLDASVSRVLPRQGGRFSVRGYADHVDQTVASVPLPGLGEEGFATAASTFYQNGVFATWQLPLLRNRGGVQDRFAVEQRQFAHDLARLQAKEGLEGLLERAGELYIDWARAEEQMRIGGDRLALSENQRDTLQQQQADGLIDTVDVLRAEEDVFLVRQALALADSDRAAIRLELGRLLGTPLTATDRPRMSLYEVPAAPVEGEVDIMGLRTVRGFLLGVDQARHAAQAAADQSRWQLDAVLSGGMRGGDETASGWVDADQPEVRVGLAVQRSLGNRSGRAAVIRYQAAEAEAAERAEASRRDTAAAVAAILSRLGRLQGVLDLDRERVDTAARRVQEEKALYARGQSSLVFVLQAQTSETRAKESWALNATRYHRLLLRYRALTDRLVPESNRLPGFSR